MTASELLVHHDEVREAIFDEKVERVMVANVCVLAVCRRQFL
jgi:hypothetical protein